MTTNVIALNEMTSAAPALDATAGLDEYEVTSEREGISDVALGCDPHDAACRWAHENLTLGGSVFVRVERGAYYSRGLYFVSHEKDGSVGAREVSE
jgi:hypothetical protein